MSKAIAEKSFVIPNDTKYDKKANTEADHAMREQDRVLRWKKVHALLRKNNKKARKEQDKIAAECAEFRAEGLIRKDKSEKMGLRWGVSLPPMTYEALVIADTMVDGHSDLSSPDKEKHLDLKGSNQIVKDLERAFPQYKVA
jgi:hypothetical protein